MKLSDYVADFLVQLSVRDVFLISGGGIMHLLDSVGRRPEINLICNLNEQATSICADSYGQYTNTLGVCMVTTGPGGTNAVTGVAASFLDSTPVLVISGQCKTQDFASLRNVRQFGAQEVDITSIVKPITKYVTTITNPEMIRYYLEKAVYLAQHGRRGPVWLDIPLDIQSAQIVPENLKTFKPIPETTISSEDLNIKINHVYELLNQSKRPVFLVGGGLIASGVKTQFLQLLVKLQIPTLTTWRARDILTDEDSLYFGSPGIPAPRFANNILQNCDLLFIIGARLNPVLTAYDEPHFAYQAKKIMVDIDVHEIKKLNMKFEEKICSDAGNFVLKMLNQIGQAQNCDWSIWREFCNNQKKKYPIIKEKQPLDISGYTDMYDFTAKLSNCCEEKDVIIGSSSGRTCGISHMAFSVKRGQRFISSMGLGSMGFVVPSAIACCIASGKRRTIALEGDGSLQHNIQELQLIKNYKLPIKLFVLSNSGYASIYFMQKNNFEGRVVACNSQGHLSFPKIEDVARTYGLEYYHIQNDMQSEEIINQVMCDQRPVLCEVSASIYFDEIPKSKTTVFKDGSFSSSSLENLYPFLAIEEIHENMPNWEKNL